MRNTKRLFVITLLIAIAMALSVSCGSKAVQTGDSVPLTVGNPYLPLWEYIPDGEPYVFEDPDNPGKLRVYVYGSHDSRKTDYCGREQVVWSAPIENLNHWRYDGEILKVDKNALGQPLNPQGLGDVLFAPDVTLKIEPDGSKTYYLYPNDQAYGRNTLIAKSSRPDGPFEVCNWSKDNPNRTEGVLEFDPAVFVDDDGRVYGYWGFERSFAAELDPATMATVKPGTEIVSDMVSGRYQPGDFKFFEAASIRKIKNKYVFVYSRFTHEGEFGLPTSNYTLAYAYSDNPLGAYTYGGTIIDARGRDIDENGRVIASATIDGNTHGGICEINGQWYVFYHRQTGLNEFARQAMVSPIEVAVDESPGGRYGHIRECLEIEHQRITPPDGVLGLTHQFVMNLAVTVRIHVFLNALPCAYKAACFLNTLLKCIAKLVPEGASALHLIIPRQMMEPQDEFLGTSINIVIE
jgi:arabinoxylan arabinofuranohydrolase